MPDPLPLPVRVLFKGPSNITYLTPMSGPRTDFNFARVLEAELLEGGRPSTIRTFSVPSELAKGALKKWEAEVLGFSPDVIALTYGQYESVHLFLPRWLERHANTQKNRPGRIRDFYRKRVVRRWWMPLAKLQARVDRSPIATLTKSWRAQRTVDDLEQFVRNVRGVGSPLVLIFEVLPPAKRYQSWFPGMTARIAEFNERAAAMVERLDEADVRIVRVYPLVEEHAEGDLEVAIPDGFHWTPHMHRVIGTELARIVAEWADTQQHLKSPSRAVARPRRINRSEQAG
ncbi:MAG: hypothetical protein QOI15_396 [Pseudonocardiales bacterium]|jgi:hypothetical protein|nr:hypothetical protein [Pseudonocardiales bacterium]MDT4919494.1 hypothetical protein [Pseudonocardiales bacterium]MDT4940503.1 hypothetical protein [Pseudonocardiales bacterium]